MPNAGAPSLGEQAGDAVLQIMEALHDLTRRIEHLEDVLVTKKVVDPEDLGQPRYI